MAVCGYYAGKSWSTWTNRSFLSFPQDPQHPQDQALWWRSFQAATHFQCSVLGWHPDRYRCPPPKPRKNCCEFRVGKVPKSCGLAFLTSIVVARQGHKMRIYWNSWQDSPKGRAKQLCQAVSHQGINLFEWLQVPEQRPGNETESLAWKGRNVQCVYLYAYVNFHSFMKQVNQRQNLGNSVNMQVSKYTYIYIYIHTYIQYIYICIYTYR